MVASESADIANMAPRRTVSRIHCRLEVAGSRVLVTNESLSGTLVNGQPVTQHELKSGEVIRLGGKHLDAEGYDGAKQGWLVFFERLGDHLKTRHDAEN